MINVLLRLLALAGFGAVGQIMRHRSFRIYMYGHIPNVIGIWVVRVAIGWLGWQLTESAFWLGVLAAADSMPVLVLGPIGGALADRRDRRKICVSTQIVLTVIAVFLTALTLSGLMTIWLLFALALARGITFAFWQPVRLALMPNLVPREDIPTAIALNSSTFNAAQFVGPAFATGLLAWGGSGLAFAFNVVAAGIMAWTLAVIDVPFARPAGRARTTVSADMIAGMRHAFGHPGIAPMLLLLLVLGTVIRPTSELLPGFADLVFHLDVEGYSLMVSSVGIGAMSGAVWMLRRGNSGGITAIALRSGLLGGAAALVFAQTNWLPLALVCLAVLGFSMTSGGVATQQIVQLAVADEMRGRVLSLFGMIFRAGPGAGALLMGRIADITGLAWPVTVGAVVGLLVYVVAYARRHRLALALEERVRAPHASPEAAPPAAAARERAAE